MNRVLEATNSSLRQQLSPEITQLGQREEDLQGSRMKLAQSQETLQVEQKAGQATRQQLQVCQSDGEKTKEALRNKETEMMNLEQEAEQYAGKTTVFLQVLLPRYLLWERRDGRACHEDGLSGSVCLSTGAPLGCSGKG